MQRTRGFTLIELMIVVVVIAVLAMIAIPSFSEYLRRGKRSEAASAIGDVQLREERFRANRTSYGDSTSADLAAGNLFGSVAAVNSYNSGLKYYNVAISGVSATGYTITATRKGTLANDPKCGNFTMTMLNGVSTRGISSGDMAYCWRQ
jgi:type IV pilus assembly protein PilE